MLITQLKELEINGLIIRKDFGEKPLRVEYSLSEKFLGIVPILDSLCRFADEYAAEQHISILHSRE